MPSKPSLSLQLDRQARLLHQGGSLSSATPALFLNRRALHRAERAEHAAVTRLGAQQNLAGAALVEEQAGVRGHRLLRGEAAVRACEQRFEDDVHDDADFLATICFNSPLSISCARSSAPPISTPMTKIMGKLNPITWLALTEAGSVRAGEGVVARSPVSGFVAIGRGDSARPALRYEVSSSR